MVVSAGIIKMMTMKPTLPSRKKPIQDNKDGVETMTDYDASHHGQYCGSESVFVHKFCYDDRHADEHHSVVAMATTVLHLLGMLLCSVYYCADAEPVKPEHTRPQPSFI